MTTKIRMLKYPVFHASGIILGSSGGELCIYDADPAI